MNNLPKRRYPNWRLLLLLICSGLLAGCDQLSGRYDQFIDERAQELEPTAEVESVVVVEPEPVDIRLVPELNQLKQAWKEDSALEIGEEAYQSNQVYQQVRPEYDVEVTDLRVIELESVANELASEFNYDDQAGAMILVRVMITNRTDQSLYFLINELRLSYQGALARISPSTRLYPARTGNLYEILQANDGLIQPHDTLEGYLVYGLSQSAYQEARQLGNVYLTVEAPRYQLDQVIGVGDDSVGEALPLFLPLNDRVSEQLLAKQAMIQDRLTAEWWGTKELLAADRIDETELTAEGTSKVTLKRVEVADFEPHEDYEANFQNFPHGQVIVSVEYQVENLSDEDLLPADAAAVLTIASDPIESDDLLNTELAGKRLAPGEVTTMIQTFALDKMRYQEVWQGEDYELEVNLPRVNHREVEVSETKTASSAESATNESVSDAVSSLEDESTEEAGESLVEGEVDRSGSNASPEADELAEAAVDQVTFSWSPKLVAYLDEDLERVDQLDPVSTPADRSDEDESASDESTSGE